MRAKLIKYGKYLAIAVLGLALFVFLWVQTGIGLPSIVSSLVSGSGQLGDATLSIGSLRGNIFRSITAKDILVKQPSNPNLIQVDQLQVEFSLFKLLSGTIHLEKTTIDSIDIQIKQDEERIWDITTLTQKQENPEKKEKESTTAIQVNEFRIDQLSLSATTFNPNRDSTYHIQDVSILIDDIKIGESVALNVNTFSGAIKLPDRSDSVSVNIQGSLSNDILSLQELRLASAKSNVFGSGTLDLQWQDSLMNSTNFAVRARPLNFDDIRIFVPGLATGQSADFMLSVQGEDQTYKVFNTLEVSDGSTLESEAVYSILSNKQFQLTLDSEIKQLNPQTYNVDGLPDGIFNATISANISGSTIKDITGYSSAYLIDSRFNTSEIDTTNLIVQWTNGVADISFDTGIDEIDLSLSGFIFPFANPTTYNIGGQIDGLDVAPLTDSTYSSDLHVDLRIAGEGFDLEKAKVDANIDINPSRFNQSNITSGAIHARLENNQVWSEVLLNTTEGSLASESLINLEEDIHIETLNAALSDFNVNPFLNNPTPASITGTINANLQMSDIPNATWDIELGKTSYGEYEIQSSTIKGDLKDERIQFTSETFINSGSISLDAELMPFEDQISYEITEGSFDNLAIGPLIQNPAFLTNLNGTFSLEGMGTDIDSMKTSGEIILSQSDVNSQSITQASISFSLLENVLQTSLDVIMPASEVRLEATVDSVASYPRLTLEQGDIKNLNVGSFLGDSSLSSSLNGTISVLASGTSINNLFLDANIDILPSTFNNAAIRESQASLYYEDGQGRLSAALFADEGSVILEADTLTLGDIPRFAFRADIENLNLANLMSQDSLHSFINTSIQGRGYGSKPQEMYLTGRATSTNTSYGEVLLDQAHVSFLLQEGLLRVDSLNLVSNIATLVARGDIALFDDIGAIASDFDAEGSIIDLSPIASFTGAEALGVSSGTYEINLSGPPGILQFDSKVDVLGILYNEYRVGEFDARIAGNLDEKRRPSSVTFSGIADQVSIPGFAMDEVIYSATYADSTVQFNLDNQIDSNRNAQINGLLSLTADSQYVTFTSVNLKLDEDQWKLQQPTQISLGSPIIVDNFHLAVEGAPAVSSQFVRLNGILDLEGTQDLKMQIKDLKIGTLASLFGFPGLDGQLNLDAILQGQASEPKLEGTMNLSVISFDRNVGNLSVAVDYDSLRLNLDAIMKHREGDSLTVNGYLPVDLRLSPPEESTTGTGISQNLAREGEVYVDIQSDSLIIGWLLPFIDQSLVDRLDGALASDIKIRGTGADPQLSGEGRFINGVIRSPIVGVTFRDINSRLSLQDNVIRFSNTSTRTGEGRFNVDGELRLQDLANAEIDINMQANEFNVINTREYRSTLSGDMKFAGTLSQPVLTGDIQLLNTDVFIDNSANQELANLNVQLTEEDLRMLENQFGVRPTARDTSSSDTYEALTIDIDIELGRDTWIRSRSNPEMNVQFNGELDFTKQPYGEQEIFGAIEVNPDRSYITQFGKRFEINQGTITFNGPATDPILNFEARYEVPSRRGQENAVTVYMDIEGTIETLELTLRSDPTMELTDMVSYVVTGQPASEALQLGGLGSQSAESIAVSSGVGLLSNAIESLVQESGLELDVIQIEPLDNARGATITAGKYVTPRIFTAVSQPIGAANADGSSNEQGTVVTIELELLDSLLLRLLGGESVMEINLLWHYAY